MWRSVLFCVLTDIKVNGVRKVTCAVHAAHWVQLENIVSTVCCCNSVVSRTCGRLKGEENIKFFMRKKEFGVNLSGLRWHLYKKGNFKKMLVHYVFKCLSASW